ncbi:heterokaryon incompatibility protein-domain-containing protein [Neurospora hispaniola]|uniref:Heterokaryon incompatibility protein-domain-containing protein n=1 Tax=Neurospora hispaniola TaxID=588809 RepID=A0AAJ0I684_9PEZI|nr:heterokaryon incompatibility protein-domain-containing protein [Neurospora hispaniola]
MSGTKRSKLTLLRLKAVYPYQPLLSENHIRLLLLEPLAPSSTQKSQPICATLHQVELDSKSLSTRPYKALSYEWVVRNEQSGHKWRVHEEQNEVNPTILLNGHIVHIGENLYNALRSIRHLDGEIGGSHLWLWVDALCINQGDVQERGRQVRSMKRIYESAEMVLVWLGMGNDLTHSATKILNLEVSELRYRFVWDTDERDELRGIRQICEMGYWRRVWILQEVVLARNYMVICNQDFVTMNRFERALALLCKHTWKTKLRELVLWLPESPAQEIMTLRSSRGTASSLIQWVKICVRCRFGATDPRDYVYALLGLSDDCEGKIEPDYSRSAREVYSSTVALSGKRSIYSQSVRGSGWSFLGDIDIGYRKNPKVGLHPLRARLQLV